MKNQKGFIVPVLLAIIAVLVIGGGVYVYQNKKAEAPILPIDTEVQGTNQVQQQITGIVIQQPTINQEVQLPITVKGYLNGNGWSAFEGVAGTVQVFDANNKAVSNMTPLQATTDWMKPIVYFEATVGDRETMSHLDTQTGVLVFKNENPKGDVVDDKEFRLPIKFINNQTSNWKTYTNTQYGFLFQYPPNTTLSTDTNGTRLILPIQSGTNLMEKTATVIAQDEQCPMVVTPRLSPNTPVMKNDISFSVGGGSEGSMNQLYETTQYTTIKNNSCIGISFFLHSGSIGAYAVPPKLFDKTSETAVFDQIISTFKFTK